MKLSGLALLAVGMVSALALCAGKSLADDLTGKPAPDFTLKTIEGQDVQLSKMKGSVVVLDFWATWCPPCRKSLPHLSKISNDAALAEKGLKVLAVNCKETSDKAQQYLTKNKLKFEVALDAQGAAEQAYAVTGIPMTVVVGRDGTIKNVFVGFGGKASETKLDAAVDKALEEPKPAK